MSQLIETRWTRYGKDRVYVRTLDGIDVGHVDLVTRRIVALRPDYAAYLQQCLARWSAPGSPADDEIRDFAMNAAGAAARAKRDEVNAQAPVRNMIARVLGVKTDERAWRVGAAGEEKVAQELAKLGPAWRVLHAVEVGEHGSDIDHVLIGPPGVFTLNTKCHPGGRAWVAERTVMVNGERTDYLRNSRHEARRASRLLTAACCRPVPVSAGIVFVGLDDFTVKQMPSDVFVTTRRGVVGWLRSRPASLDAEAIEAIYDAARLSTTWTAVPRTRRRPVGS